MEEKKYILTENQLLELLQDSLELQYLKANGVDNWCWYGEGRSLFIAECLNISEEEVAENNYGIDDIAIKLLNIYKEVQ